MERRRFLHAASAAGIAAVAGCTMPASSGGGDDTPTATSGATPTDEPTGSGDGTPEGTPTPGERDIDTHPAAQGLADQPTLGDISSGTVIVAFEDPSCTLCRRFEADTYPRIVSDLVDTGKAAFAYRGYPIIYPWGDPASHVLEATYAADADAFWTLKDHYYAEQSSFDTENVYELSQSFLDSETSVDAEAVVTAAREGDADAAVAADVAAGEELGIGQTPVFYLFRDGAFRTAVRGPQGYSVFETALGL